MKLRLTDGSVRLRLEAAELNDFAVLGRLEDKVVLGPGEGGSLRFALESSDVSDVCASLDGGMLTISLPKQAAKRWVGSKEVGIEAGQIIEGRSLLIQVEKDLGRRFPRHVDE